MILRSGYKYYFFIAFILTILILSIAGYFQYRFNLKPCPLCLMQRFIFIILSIILFLTCLLPRSYAVKRFSSVLVLGFACLGLYFSGRQIWLQHLPSEANFPCLPDWDVLLNNFSTSFILKQFFYGTAQCGKVDWTGFGLSFAEWSFLFFCIFFALGAIFLSKK